MPRKNSQVVIEADPAPVGAVPLEKTSRRGTSVPRRSSKSISSSEKASAPAPVGEVTYEQIARRAYELYVSGAPGGQLDHWLAAERQLRGA